MVEAINLQERKEKSARRATSSLLLSLFSTKIQKKKKGPAPPIFILSRATIRTTGRSKEKGTCLLLSGGEQGGEALKGGGA